MAHLNTRNTRLHARFGDSVCWAVPVFPMAAAYSGLASHSGSPTTQGWTQEMKSVRACRRRLAPMMCQVAAPAHAACRVFARRGRCSVRRSVHASNLVGSVVWGSASLFTFRAEGPSNYRWISDSVFTSMSLALGLRLLNGPMGSLSCARKPAMKTIRAGSGTIAGKRASAASMPT